VFQKSFDGSPSLYLISTPIGNMEDITLRAIKVLNSVDVIFCEDTRVSKKMLDYYNINKKLISANDNNENLIKQRIDKYLNNNRNVALISDAGTPLINDPGYKIISYILEKNINVISIPGVTAFTPALTSSGLSPYPFLFFGFLSNKSEKRNKQLIDLKNDKNTLIFYEAPHRVIDTLKQMLNIFGDRKISISREITKIHEEVFRGKISDYLFSEKTIKGEIVIVVEGKTIEEELSEQYIVEKIDEYIKDGFSSNNAIKKVADENNISKNKIYNMYHKR
jgi:16S rRNA (cytidine1402-2'-O)-methyltransferase